MSSTSSSDTSLLIRPIELASSTIIQLLNAKTNVTKEVLRYLEQECDAILECRQCRSLFRSLANFISHKRIYCQGDAIDRQVLAARYPAQSPTVIEPVDPDVDQLASQPAKPVANAKRTMSPNKKTKPVRSTLPADLAKVKQRSAALTFSTIPGVECALSQTNTESDTDGRSSAATNSSDKSDVIITVEPKDGYPNMNLRQRNSRTSLAIDCDDSGLQDDRDHEKEDFKVPFTNTNRTTKIARSKVALAEMLSKRPDCDVTLLKCWPCNSVFPSTKALNVHMMSKHSKQRKLYPCVYCKNVFTQFWGVTRHLKRAHAVTGDNIDKVREQIRSRVFTDPLPLSETEKPGNTDNPGSKKKNTHSTGTRLCCNVCAKEFNKRQYLHLHMVACYRKSGLEPPFFKEHIPQSKAIKPLLFVCKTCNRAFSMRQSMVQHAAGCFKRHRENVSTKSNSPGGGGKTVNSDKSPSTGKSASAEKSPNANKSINAEKSPQADKAVNNTNKPSSLVKKETDMKVSPKRDVPQPPSTPPPANRGKTVVETPKKEQTEKGKSKQKVTETKSLEADDIFVQLSPSDEAKEEERNLSPPGTPTSLALGRPRRSIKPKPFCDGTIRVRDKVPEVVRVQQPDGSQVYKLKKDVETGVAPTEEEPASESTAGADIVKAKDTKAARILIQGESVPLLDAEDEAKIAGIIDIGKLVCLKCKRQYGSSSNLRRHAVRHLGWRRYKCKLCKFTSYNKSECKSHLRKCHHAEVATLLDGGLAPYIIDLGALLDDSNDEVGRLNLSLPNNSENGRHSPTNRKTRKSKESKSETAVNAKPKEKSTVTKAKPDKRRPKKQQTEPVSPTPSKSVSSVKSVASSGSLESSAVRPGCSTEVAPFRTRGRARKQELCTLSDSEIFPPQDENNKRPRSSQSGGEDSLSLPTPSKVARVLDVSDRQDPVLQKEQSNKLEGLINKLKGPRKPLTGAEDNSKLPNSDTKESVKQVKDIPSDALAGVPSANSQQ